MDNRIQRYTENIATAALIGYDTILANYGKGIPLISKGGVDACTAVDKKTEAAARDYLVKHGIPVFGEEAGGDLGSGVLAILDKIDGTPNFRSGIPAFGSVAALVEGDEPQVSAILLPMTGELYLAIKGWGSYLVNVSLDEEFVLEEVIVDLHSFFAESPNHFSRIYTTQETDPKKVQVGADLGYENRARKLAQVAKYADGVFYCPIPGSVSFSMCQVASSGCNGSGGYGGYVAFDLGINDIAPGILLVTEAGGIVTDLEGKSPTRETRTIVAAANPSIHQFLLERLND